MGGHVAKTGPGYPIPDSTPDESWTTGRKEVKYLPLQAAEGDYAIFLKDAAMEIEFEERKYLIVPIRPSLQSCVRNYQKKMSKKSRGRNRASLACQGRNP
jgi:hypothetical protein